MSYQCHVPPSMMPGRSSSWIFASLYMIFPGIQVKVVNSYAPVSDDLFFGGFRNQNASATVRTVCIARQHIYINIWYLDIHTCKSKSWKRVGVCVCAFYREWREDVNVWLIKTYERWCSANHPPSRVEVFFSKKITSTRQHNWRKVFAIPFLLA